MDTRRFYQELKPFSRFRDLTSAQYYQPVPDDWKVVITDIRGSTDAIEQGRYRDVNTLGAATIVAAHNAMGSTPFPYVFGGDGASMIIPAEYESAIREQLLSLREIASSRFDMELRVGLVGMDEI